MANNNTHKELISKPLLTLVLCCYNVSDYIETMMESLLNQYFGKKLVKDSKEIEILLVEDFSNDNDKTLDKCKKYEAKYPNIRLIRHKKNKGLSASRNTGIKNAKGKYISFPDPDDSFCPDVLNAYYNAIQNNTDLICGGVTEVHHDRNDKVIKTIQRCPAKQIHNGKKSIAKLTIEMEKEIYFGYVWNKLYKKENIDKYKIYFIENLLFVEDILFNIQYFDNCKKAQTLDIPIIEYNRRLKSSNSITANKETKYFELHYLRIEKLMEYWKKNNVLNVDAKNVLANLYFRYALSTIWRNSEMCPNIYEQKEWIKQFYNLELTIKLIPYLKSNYLFLNITNNLFKRKNVNLLLKEAKIIKFVTKHMDRTLILLRQNR